MFFWASTRFDRRPRFVGDENAKANGESFTCFTFFDFILSTMTNQTVDYICLYASNVGKLLNFLSKRCLFYSLLFTFNLIRDIARNSYEIAPNLVDVPAKYRRIHMALANTLNKSF